jgi:hypothetical protein
MLEETALGWEEVKPCFVASNVWPFGKEAVVCEDLGSGFNCSSSIDCPTKLCAWSAIIRFNISLRVAVCRCWPAINDKLETPMRPRTIKHIVAKVISTVLRIGPPCGLLKGLLRGSYAAGSEPLRPKSKRIVRKAVQQRRPRIRERIRELPKVRKHDEVKGCAGDRVMHPAYDAQILDPYISAAGAWQ